MLFHKRKTKPRKDDAPVVYGNESFGIPADCTKKQRFSTLKLSVYLVVVILLCGLVYGGYRTFSDYVLPEYTYNTIDAPLLYVKDRTLTIKEQDAHKATPVSTSFRYTADNAEQMVFINDEESLLFYGEGTEQEQGFSLYVKSTEKDADPLLIDQNVTKFTPSDDGKLVVYTKGSHLFISHMKKPEIIAVDVLDFALSKNNQQIVYQKEGGRLYTCGTGKNSKPVMAENGISVLLSPMEDYSKFYYLKNGALYEKAHGEEPVCLEPSVKDAVMLRDLIYFVKEELRPVAFSHLVEDTNREKDSKITPPKKADYYKMRETGKMQFDQAGYSADVAEYKLAATRNIIRDHFAKTPVTAPTNVLYRIKRNGKTELDTNLTNTPLSTRLYEGGLLYEKYLPAAEKIDLVTLTSVQEAHDATSAYLLAPKEVGLSLLLPDKAPFSALSFVPEKQTELSKDGKYVYVIQSQEGNEGDALIRYQVGARSLKNPTVLKESVTEFSVDETDSEVVILFDENRLDIAQGTRVTHLADASCRSFFYVDGTLFFYEDYKEQEEVGDLKTYRNGRVHLVDIGVHDFRVQNLKTVTYIKHYNREVGFGELYRKHGSARAKRLDVCVRGILSK